MHILVVDDELHIRKLLVSILTKTGYKVTEAENGYQAFEILQKEKIHFVISDWVMNGITGLELCEKIRKDLKQRYVYFILLTSKNNKNELVQGMESGADDFIVKPFNIEELKVRIRAGERIINKEIELIERNKKLSEAYETMQKDLAAAAKLQESLLPFKDTSINILHESILPTNNLLIKDINFDWLFIPSQFLAGDVFNIFRLDENHIGLYLIDVAGHGIPASLLSVTLSRMLIPFQNNFLKNIIPEEPFYEIYSPSKVISKLNTYFSNDSESMQYFTMVYMIIDLTTGKTRVTKAGHTSPIILKNNGANIIIDEPSFPVGLMPFSEYTEEEIILEKGDKVIIYSDGITECNNSDKGLYEEQRFIDFLDNNKNNSLKLMISNLQQELIDWNCKETFEDDLSLLAVEIL